MREEMQTNLGPRVTIYVQDSSNLLLCAHDKTEQMLDCWAKEICGLLDITSRDG